MLLYFNDFIQTPGQWPWPWQVADQHISDQSTLDNGSLETNPTQSFYFGM